MDKVLRASKAGFPCLRNLWYSVNGYQEVVSQKSQRIFDVGTALEPYIVEWLKTDGWEVEYNPGSQNAELEVTVPIIGGKIAGHPDCIISKGEIQNALVDIKTMNEWAFKTWKKKGTLITKPQYVTQLHIYAMGLQRAGRTIERLGIVGVNKNNSEMHIDFFNFDEGTCIAIMNRAETIINASEAPEFDCPTEEWACGYCEFSQICKPTEKICTEIQDNGEPIPVTQDETILNAMKTLQRARDLTKQAKALETEAKETLDENVRDKGLSAIQGDGLIFTMKQKTQTRFDEKALNAEHPELAGKYTKQVIATTYDIEQLR